MPIAGNKTDNIILNMNNTLPIGNAVPSSFMASIPA